VSHVGPTQGDSEAPLTVDQFLGSFASLRIGNATITPSIDVTPGAVDPSLLNNFMQTRDSGFFVGARVRIPFDLFCCKPPGAK
jgi:hypothetical protein